MSTPDEPHDPLTPPHGFADLVGYRLADWSEGRADIVLTVTERHLNRSAILHGGVLTTLLDTAAGYAGCYCAVPGHVRRAMTLQLSTQFLAPALEGMRLIASGRLTGGGRSVFFAEAEVRDDDGTLIGRGEGVFKYRSGHGDPEGVPAAEA